MKRWKVTLRDVDSGEEWETEVEENYPSYAVRAAMDTRPRMFDEAERMEIVVEREE